jgi:tryptophan-rich sensory protein
MGLFLVALLELIILYFTSWVFVYYLSLNNKAYFYLNLPYLIWLLIATYLNIGIMLLN